MKVKEVFKFEIFESKDLKSVLESVNYLFSRDDIRIVDTQYQLILDADSHKLYSVAVTYAYTEPV